MEKTTSKREFRFVCDTLTNSLKIINDQDQTLRTYYLEKLGKKCQAYSPLHGMKQKFTDDTMVSKIGEDGDRLLACDALYANLIADEWEKERVGIARAPEALIRLVMELKGIDRVTSEASLKTAGKEKWDAISKAHATRVAKITEEIKGEKGKAAAMDLDDLTK